MTPAASAIEQVRLCIGQDSAPIPSDAHDKRVIQQLLDTMKCKRDFVNIVHNDSAPAVRSALDELDRAFAFANLGLHSAELQDLVLEL